MTDKKDKSAKRGKRLVKFLGFGLLAIAAGGGTAFGLMAAGMFPGDRAQAHETGPQYVLKGEDDPYAPSGGKENGSEADRIHGAGGTKYRTAYFSFEDEFTSNLRDTDALIQLSLAASTRRDGRVLMWLDEHELAIRSRMLVTLADTPLEDVETPAGKKRLQQRLTKAVNDVLEEQEGFGGVDSVFFRTIIVQ